MVSAPAFHLKGSGWYKTEYGPKEGGKKEVAPDSKEEKSEKSGKSDSSDAKKVKESPKKDSGSSK